MSVMDNDPANELDRLVIEVLQIMLRDLATIRENLLDILAQYCGTDTTVRH